MQNMPNIINFENNKYIKKAFTLYLHHVNDLILYELLYMQTKQKYSVYNFIYKFSTVKNYQFFSGMHKCISVCYICGQ